MSNNKLYTEEQVKQIQQAILCNYKDAIMDENYCLNVTTPTELPSDDEIQQESDEFELNSKVSLGMHISFENGAKWMRNKIQGGNNEDTNRPLS
jgi:hypothetical protein